MANAFLDKLKKTIIEGATFSAAKAEKAARKGKKHLDILTERRKLSSKFEAFGRITLQAIEDNSLETMKEDQQCITLLGEIRVLQDKIEELSKEQVASEK